MGKSNAEKGEVKKIEFKNSSKQNEAWRQEK